MGGFLPLLFDLPRQKLVEDGRQVGGGWGQRGSREGGTSLTRSGPLDCPCPPESWLAFSQLLLNLGLNGHSKFPLLLSLLGSFKEQSSRFFQVLMPAAANLMAKIRGCSKSVTGGVRAGEVEGPSIRSLLDLPVEVLDHVLEDLSVIDLRSLSSTNSFLADVLRRSCIWRSALADILEIVPMPRLSYALADMGYHELRRTAVRLATYDRDLGRTSHAWRLLKRPPYMGDAPKFVPGGKHVLYSSGVNLMICDCHSSGATNGAHVLGPFDHGIRQFSVFPCSASEVLIMVAVGPPGWREEVPTRIMVYRCDPAARTHLLLDDFMVEGQVLESFLDARHVAVQWCHYAPSYRGFHRGYVRDHTRGMGTGTLEFEGLKFNVHMTIAITSLSQKLHPPEKRL